MVMRQLVQEQLAIKRAQREDVHVADAMWWCMMHDGGQSHQENEIKQVKSYNAIHIRVTSRHPLVARSKVPLPHKISRKTRMRTRGPFLYAVGLSRDNSVVLSVLVPRA